MRERPDTLRNGSLGQRTKAETPLSLRNPPKFLLSPVLPFAATKKKSPEQQEHAISECTSSVAVFSLVCLQKFGRVVRTLPRMAVVLIQYDDILRELPLDPFQTVLALRNSFFHTISAELESSNNEFPTGILQWCDQNLDFHCTIGEYAIQDGDILTYVQGPKCIQVFMAAKPSRRDDRCYELEYTSSLTVLASKFTFLEAIQSLESPEMLMLSWNSKELTNPDATLSSLGIYPGSVLTAKFKPPADRRNLVNDVESVLFNGSDQIEASQNCPLEDLLISVFVRDQDFPEVAASQLFLTVMDEQNAIVPTALIDSTVETKKFTSHYSIGPLKGSTSYIMRMQSTSPKYDSANSFFTFKFRTQKPAYQLKFCWPEAGAEWSVQAEANELRIVHGLLHLVSKCAFADTNRSRIAFRAVNSITGFGIKLPSNLYAFYPIHNGDTELDLSAFESGDTINVDIQSSPGLVSFSREVDKAKNEPNESKSNTERSVSLADSLSQELHLVVEGEAAPEMSSNCTWTDSNIAAGTSAATTSNHLADPQDFNDDSGSITQNVPQSQSPDVLILKVDIDEAIASISEESENYEGTIAGAEKLQPSVPSTLHISAYSAGSEFLEAVDGGGEEDLEIIDADDFVVVVAVDPSDTTSILESYDD